MWIQQQVVDVREDNFDLGFRQQFDDGLVKLDQLPAEGAESRRRHGRFSFPWLQVSFQHGTDDGDEFVVNEFDVVVVILLQLSELA